MKLDHDCVRLLLLAIEADETSLKITESTLLHSEFLKDYSEDELRYTVARLREAGFINATPVPLRNQRLTGHIINSLTYNGHEFLDSIRDNKVWELTKKSVSTVAGASLSVMFQVASQHLKQKLGIE